MSKIPYIWNEDRQEYVPITNLKSTLMIDEVKSNYRNILVSNIGWETTQNPNYSDYPYYKNIPIDGITNSMIPEVTFGVKDASSGNFAPVSETYDGGVRIYTLFIPRENIIIPNIAIWRV